MCECCRLSYSLGQPMLPCRRKGVRAHRQSINQSIRGRSRTVHQLGEGWTGTGSAARIWTTRAAAELMPASASLVL